MSASIFTIRVVTRTQDNGDGGYTTYAYNTEDELIADHPKSDEMTDVLRKEILTEKDPYENGYIGMDLIEVKMVNGQVVLAKPICFHAGQ
jgi:hypothetical protein